MNISWLVHLRGQQLSGIIAKFKLKDMQSMAGGQRTLLLFLPSSWACPTNSDFMWKLWTVVSLEQHRWLCVCVCVCVIWIPLGQVIKFQVYKLHLGYFCWCQMSKQNFAWTQGLVNIALNIMMTALTALFGINSSNKCSVKLHIISQTCVWQVKISPVKVIFCSS